MADELDPIDALLRADEERLKARRQRLKALATSIARGREAVAAAQSDIKAALEAADLSRSELASTFQLTKAEKSLLLPPSGRGRKRPPSPTGTSDLEG